MDDFKASPPNWGNLTHAVIYSEDGSYSQGFAIRDGVLVAVDEFTESWSMPNGWTGELTYRKDTD